MSEQQTGALLQRLKADTRALHARAERAGVMAALLSGKVTRHQYVALLANLQAIYGALEASLEAQGTLTAMPALARSAALAADLRGFEAAPQTMVPATLEYVERLRAQSSADPHRLWAHVYVRYLGDLHGGQILSRLVQKHFADVDGTSFYDFGDDANVHALRTDLRTQLAALSLGVVQADDVVAEAVWAFEAHCQIFEQIQATR